MLLYYITDRRQFTGSEAQRRLALLAKIAEAARAGVDFIQLREKDLPAAPLEILANQAVRAVREAAPAVRGSGLSTRLLINSRIDVALACGADGVHLRGDDISAGDARAIFDKAGVPHPLIAVSCHTAEQVRLAESHGADLAVFGPVFGKGAQPGVGLEALRAACRGAKAVSTPEPSRPPGMPVLALGGVTLPKAHACLEAGAAGVAGIRLFQENDIHEIVSRLRSQSS
ncbi:MAG: thiamine phosphate synthase [Terriglobales bacterium]